MYQSNPQTEPSGHFAVAQVQTAIPIQTSPGGVKNHTFNQVYHHSNTTHVNPIVNISTVPGYLNSEQCYQNSTQYHPVQNIVSMHTPATYSRYGHTSNGCDLNLSTKALSPRLNTSPRQPRNKQTSKQNTSGYQSFIPHGAFTEKSSRLTASPKINQQLRSSDNRHSFHGQNRVQQLPSTSQKHTQQSPGHVQISVHSPTHGSTSPILSSRQSVFYKTDGSSLNSSQASSPLPKARVNNKRQGHTQESSLTPDYKPVQPPSGNNLSSVCIKIKFD
jgi:hypothetical protein